MATKSIRTLSILTALGTLSAVADEVILDYEATAQTVSGTPFGITVPRLTVVTGSFIYETDGAVDSNPSPERGNYQLTAGGGFAADVLDHAIRGSMTPFLQVEDIQVGGGSIDTFRFIDGDDNSPNQGGIMSLDDIPDGDIALRLAMTDGSGAAFADDSLPVLFPMLIRPSTPPHLRIPHTFSLGDDQGTMLLQFNWLLQRKPNKLRITEVGFAGEDPYLKFHSQPGQTYDIEFTLDLKTWEVIETDLLADEHTTEFIDSGIVTRLGLLPDAAYYRVRESG